MTKKLATRLLASTKALGEAISLDPFGETDWDAWAGAERPEGNEPHIAYILVDEKDAVVIVDKNAITVNLDLESMVPHFLRKDHSGFDQSLVWTSDNLKPNMSKEEILNMGFTEVV
jgi:hypothetical protein